MPFCASVPVADVEAANSILEGLGFGPDNFSVPICAEGLDTEATHASLSHGGVDPVFRAAVAALPNVLLDDDHFDGHIRKRLLAWRARETWKETPFMKGDPRAYGGKAWVSLVDYNVWTPPYGWREVGAIPPLWVQPANLQSAYPAGARVRLGGKVWRSLLAANMFRPGIRGWAEVFGG